MNAFQHLTPERRAVVLQLVPRHADALARRRTRDLGRTLALILVGLVCGYALGVQDAGRKPAQVARVRASR